MSKAPARHIFGPVPSRRLGLSLGVDLVPFKICSYDCLYCQLGRTTSQTIERAEYVPTEPVLQQVESHLARGPSPDYITLSGSGEPTLHSRIGEVITRLKTITDIPVAVLTNGSLLWQPEVQQALYPADLVIPSLDAGSAKMFESVNRPHERIPFKQMVGGLVSFRSAFPGQIWLEVLLLKGFTDRADEVRRIKRYTDRIRPDRIQVNTAIRPPAEGYVIPVPEKRLEELCALLGDNAEVIADYDHVHQNPAYEAKAEEVLVLVQRRPCTLADIAEGLSIHPNEASKYIRQLLSEEQVKPELRQGRVYYRVA